MSSNNIVVFEEQANGTFKAYHWDMDCYCEGQHNDEQPIFHAATMRECVQKYEEWCNEMSKHGFTWIVEYGYTFELRAGNEANPS